MDQQPHFRVWWDEEHHLIRLATVGESDEAVAGGTADAIRAMRQEHGEDVDLLVDVSQSTKTSARARQIYAQVSKEGRGRSAFFGASLTIRVVINLVFGAAGASDRMKQFATEAEALAWLRRRTYL